MLYVSLIGQNHVESIGIGIAFNVFVDGCAFSIELIVGVLILLIEAARVLLI